MVRGAMLQRPTATRATLNTFNVTRIFILLSRVNFLYFHFSHFELASSDSGCEQLKILVPYFNQESVTSG
jgi:hypothetical protein